MNTGRGDPQLQADESNSEGISTNIDISLTPTGFQLTSSGLGGNASGGTYIYIAIRRPHKPPEAATDVFATDVGNGSASGPTFDSNFPVDLAWLTRPANADGMRWTPRLTGGKYMTSSSSAAEAGPDSWAGFDDNNGWGENYGSNYRSWMFKRAPGFFDIVAYDGTGSARNISHNLTVAPELIIGKCRNAASTTWLTYASSLGATKYLELNDGDAEATASTVWNDTAPTSSVFSVGTSSGINGSGRTYVAYLFASLDGISKVGSYTGTGSNINVDCGFTAGARFVLIKRTDSTGDWYVWDTARGIIAGNDPYVLLNSTAAEVTSTDYIDPLNSGFTVTSTAPAGLNASGGTYLFLAIA
jgi:hypothetical protein